MVHRVDGHADGSMAHCIKAAIANCDSHDDRQGTAFSVGLQQQNINTITQRISTTTKPRTTMTLKGKPLRLPLASVPAVAVLCLAILLVFSPHLSASVSAFAAKKNNRNKKNASASNNKGFGAAPPTLEEVASKFRVRIPENAASLPCPCQVNNQTPLLYSDCCQPYHQGSKQPESPLRVLQSRYSAFAYRLVPYIMQTTHPTCRDYRDNVVTWAKDMNQEGMFDSFDFVGLTYGETSIDADHTNKATIDFQVRLRSKEGDQQETVVSEKSLFLRYPDTEVWSYASGEVRSTVAGLEDAVLNQ